MRPLQITAHTRPVTTVLFNRDGDLMFSAAKDQEPRMWFSSNAHLVTTYKGHKGSVMDMSVDFNSTQLLTASGDGTVMLWDLEHGSVHTTITIEKFAPGRAVEFDVADKRFAVGTGRTHNIYVYDVPSENQWNGGAEEKGEMAQPFAVFTGHTKEVNAILWGPRNERVYSCSNDGTIKVFNVQEALDKGGDYGKLPNCKVAIEELSVKVTESTVNCISYSKDKTMIICGSDDLTARLYDTDSMTLLKQYKSTKPVICCCIHPILNIVMVSGGQAARDVTTTKAKKGKFEVEFYHLVQEDLIAQVKTGHFSPINSLAITPDGKKFVTGAEESIIKLWPMEDNFTEKFKKLELSYSSTS